MPINIYALLLQGPCCPRVLLQDRRGPVCACTRVCRAGAAESLHIHYYTLTHTHISDIITLALTSVTASVSHCCDVALILFFFSFNFSL